ncbi:hypothetical protein [Rickettsia hoogstraalii]|nr:hypothetical protein [Rickettsia hoogstraalii]
MLINSIFLIIFWIATLLSVARNDDSGVHATRPRRNDIKSE